MAIDLLHKPAHSLNKNDIKTLQGRAASISKRIEKVKAHTEKITEKIVRTAEVAGTAFAVGIMYGKTYDEATQRTGIEVMGVPLELGGGLALNVLGYMGAAGKMSDHLGNIGDGMLAAFAVKEGTGIGDDWRKKSLAAGGGSGTPATAKGSSLTPEEVAHAAAMAQGR